MNVTVDALSNIANLAGALACRLPNASEKTGSSLGCLFFCLISDIFRSFCLVIMKYFVYLQAERVLQQSVPLLHKCE